MMIQFLSLQYYGIFLPSHVGLMKLIISIIIFEKVSLRDVFILSKLKANSVKLN